jgi:hypothetical protein
MTINFSSARKFRFFSIIITELNCNPFLFKADFRYHTYVYIILYLSVCTLLHVPFFLIHIVCQKVQGAISHPEPTLFLVHFLLILT